MVDAAVADVATAAGTQGMVVVVGEAVASMVAAAMALVALAPVAEAAMAVDVVEAAAAVMGAVTAADEKVVRAAVAWRMHWQHSAPFGLQRALVAEAQIPGRHAWSTKSVGPTR